MRTTTRTLFAALALWAAGVLSAQAHMISFDLLGKAGAGLLSGNQNQPINGTPGSGGEVGSGIVFNDQTGVLTINVAWGSGNGFTNLSGNGIAAHIHGPTASSGTAAFNEDAPVMINLDDTAGWNPSATNGGITRSVTLDSTQISHLFAGRLYINVHTAANGAGEIRGNLVRQAFVETNPIPALIPHGPQRIELELVASGLVSPGYLVSPPDGTDRQFILDQAGQIRIIENGVLLTTPFLDVTSLLVTPNTNFDERGLLGLAFDPGFANSTSPGFRRIFTYTSQPAASGTADLTDQYATTINHHAVISSWRVDATNPNVVDTTSRIDILRVEKPQANHNGGTVAFGPDDFLYISLGDGGGANDNNANGHNPLTGNGQDPNIALGKILRIDVNGTNSANGRYGIPATNPFAVSGGVKEIFALGLRNPYRFSFNGSELLVGDVGQNRVEELNRVEVGKNYGWRQKEGTFKFNPADGTVSDDLTGVPAGLTDPIAQYDRDEGISIIGGYVYDGSLLPALDGKYVFGDFARDFTNPSGRLFYYDFTAAEIREFIIGRDDRALGLFVKGMGQDQNGEVYVLGSTVLGPTGTTGVVYKLVPVPSQFLNISTRARVGTGDDALIGGFIPQGTAQKKVLVRALGPSLTQFGLSGLLADPTLEVRGPNGVLIASNDNWKSTQQTEIESTGLQPPNEAEPAIVTTLPTTDHTAIVRGKDNTTGIGVVEVYDLDQLADSRLANISTRGHVQPGDHVMIGGFIPGGGSANLRVLLRAIGPSLSQLGIANPLADPTLELRDGNGALVIANDDWRDDSAQETLINGTGIPPSNDAESAIVATLTPAQYTAIVAGKGSATGVALVEAYDLQ
jgi:glucose/arabinose dehydrogenase